MTADRPTPLSGREVEQRRMADLVDDARAQSGSAVVVIGEPGIGKSALLDDLVASQPEVLILRCRGVESEMNLPYAALYSLLRPVLDGIDDLPSVQAQSLRSAFALGPPAGTELFAVGAASLSLLSAAGDRCPVLCVVDDAHWLDTASAQALLFVARRLGHDRVAVVLAARSDEAERLDLRGITTVDVGGLRTDAVDALLRGKGIEVTPEVLIRLHSATGGNPLALLEIGPGLTDGERRGTEPLGAGVEWGLAHRMFSDRIAALTAEQRFALLVAAVGPGSSPATIRRALVEADSTWTVLTSIESTGLVSANRSEVRFQHPLVRSAAVSAAAPLDISRAHSALASARPKEDVAERAWDRAAAATDPDESVAADLEGAAALSAARGDSHAAARAMQSAARLTPDAATRAGRLLTAAQFSISAGAPAAPILEEALTLNPGNELRLDIQIFRMLDATVRGDLDLVGRLVRHEIGEVDDADALRAAHVLAFRVIDQWSFLERRGLDADLARLGALLSEPALNTAPSTTLPHLAFAVAVAADRFDLKPLRAEAARAAAAPDLVTPLLIALCFTGEFALSDKLLADVVATARARGSLGALGWILSVASQTQLAVGQLAEAEASAEEAVEMAVLTRNAHAELVGRSSLARIAILRGEIDEAREHLQQLRELGGAVGVPVTIVWVDVVAGLFACAEGRYADAVSDFERVREFGRSWPLLAVSLHQIDTDLIDALLRLDRRDEASIVLDGLEGCAPDMPGAWPGIVLCRCRAMLARDRSFEAHFDEAIGLHRHHPSRLELGRSRLLYGERLRRSRKRKAARAQLVIALDDFDAVGATVLAERTRAELVSTGAGPTPARTVGRDRLTPQERRVALAVATGRRNADVAAELFISPKTVEMHLSRVYRKLDIASRSELVRMVAEGGPAVLQGDLRR